MNGRFEKWLDEQLEKTINSGKVEFNVERWKQKYADEYQMLVSRNEKRPDAPRLLWASQLARIAAVIALVALAIFLVPRRPEKHAEPAVVTKPDKSPATMMSRLSLTRAYERGGLDAMDEQCEKAFKMLGKKNTQVTARELLNESSGKKQERK
jgi:hypothetical protein